MSQHLCPLMHRELIFFPYTNMHLNCLTVKLVAAGSSYLIRPPVQKVGTITSYSIYLRNICCYHLYKKRRRCKLCVRAVSDRKQHTNDDISAELISIPVSPFPSATNVNTMVYINNKVCAFSNNGCSKNKRNASFWKISVASVPKKHFHMC